MEGLSDRIDKLTPGEVLKPGRAEDYGAEIEEPKSEVTTSKIREAVDGENGRGCFGCIATLAVVGAVASPLIWAAIDYAASRGWLSPELAEVVGTINNVILSILERGGQ